MARQDFVQQLCQLGLDVGWRGDDSITFDFVIPVGKFLGQTIKLGFEVPGDFPAVPPAGPHISPRLLPLNTQSKVHPSGGVHESKFGPDWEYWSRPFPDGEWNKTEKTAKVYMAHIRKLFETQ